MSPLEIMPFSLEEINPLLSDKPVVIFSEETARQNNTDVSQDPSTDFSRLIPKHKAKNVPRGEVESLLHEDMCNLTMELYEFALKQKSMVLCEIEFERYEITVEGK